MEMKMNKGDFLSALQGGIKARNKKVEADVDELSISYSHGVEDIVTQELPNTDVVSLDEFDDDIVDTEEIANEAETAETDDSVVDSDYDVSDDDFDDPEDELEESEDEFEEPDDGFEEPDDDFEDSEDFEESDDEFEEPDDDLEDGFEDSEEDFADSEDDFEDSDEDFEDGFEDSEVPSDDLEDGFEDSEDTSDGLEDGFDAQDVDYEEDDFDDAEEEDVNEDDEFTEDDDFPDEEDELDNDFEDEEDFPDEEDDMFTDDSNSVDDFDDMDDDDFPDEDDSFDDEQISNAVAEVTQQKRETQSRNIPTRDEDKNKTSVSATRVNHGKQNKKVEKSDSFKEYESVSDDIKDAMNNIVYEKGMSVRSFLRENKDYRDARYVTVYFSREELRNAEEMGIIFKKNNKYYI